MCEWRCRNLRNCISFHNSKFHASSYNATILKVCHKKEQDTRNNLLSQQAVFESCTPVLIVGRAGLFAACTVRSLAMAVPMYLVWPRAFVFGCFTDSHGEGSRSSHKHYKEILQRNGGRYIFSDLWLYDLKICTERIRGLHTRQVKSFCVCVNFQESMTCERCHELLRYDGSHVREDCEAHCPSMSYPAEGIGPLKCEQCRQVRQVSTFVLCTTAC